MDEWGMVFAFIGGLISGWVISDIRNHKGGP